MKPSRSYQWAMVLAAGALLLVLLLYLALVVGVAAFAAWHGWSHTGLLETWVGVLLYVVPLFVAAALFVFLLKPVFARPVAPPPGRPLVHEEHPRLFQLIGAVCQEVGTAPPSRVEVDGSVNASVAFREGWSSLAEHDLVLRVGLPLVAGLSAREFAGVLAHEFGHFRQQTGMRLSFVVRRLSHWFWRIAHERDAFDEAIDEAIADDPSLLALVLLRPLRAGIGFTRWILRGLLLLAHAASCRLLRQMELDADAHEVRIAGTDAFLSTCRRLRRLAVVQGALRVLLGRAWRERRLPDNLPEFIRHTAENLPPDRVEAMEAMAAATPTGLFDTHPSDADREAAAVAAEEPGRIDLDEPASGLFGAFPDLCREVTADFYASILGGPPEPGRMVPVETLTGAMDQEAASRAALGAFAPVIGPYWCPLSCPPESLADPVPVPQLYATIAEGRTLLSAVPDGASLVGELGRTLSLRMRLYAAEQFRLARIEWEPQELDLPTDEPGRLAVMEEEAASRQAGVEAQLAPGIAAASSRLRASLQLWWHDSTVAAGPDAAEVREEIRRLMPVLYHVGGVSAGLVDLERMHAALQGLLMRQGKAADPERWSDALERLARPIRRRIREIFPRMAGVPHPFAGHPDGRWTVQDTLRAESDEGDGLQGAITEAGAIRSQLPELYARSLARLAALALEAERRAGA